MRVDEERYVLFYQKMIKILQMIESESYLTLRINPKDHKISFVAINECEYIKDLSGVPYYTG